MLTYFNQNKKNIFYNLIFRRMSNVVPKINLRIHQLRTVGTSDQNKNT